MARHKFNSETARAAALKLDRGPEYRRKMAEAKRRPGADYQLECSVCGVWFCALKFDRNKLRPTMQRATCSSEGCIRILREQAAAARARKWDRQWLSRPLPPNPTTP